MTMKKQVKIRCAILNALLDDLVVCKVRCAVLNALSDDLVVCDLLTTEEF